MVFSSKSLFFATFSLAVGHVFAHPASLGHALEARQLSSIKQVVGNWNYKGCYQDLGPRVLQNRFTIPGGNSAEKCTTLCHNAGYLYAGLEYGTECWCDNAMAYSTLKPDSDCSFTCPGDALERCGAGNRLEVYQENPATSVAPKIKQTVGTWQYKGCYRDFGTRILTFRFDVPSGNNVERCTSLCQSKGYSLAGMEYGTECWCDKYLPYGQAPLVPDTDCNFRCPADPTEFCGAGSRMSLYLDTAATPPSPDHCIDWRDGFSFGNNVLQAIPKTGSGPVTKLYAIPTNPWTEPIYYTIISTCPAGCPYTDYYNFGIIDNILTSYNSRPLIPNVGESQSFIFKWPQTVTGYAGYCAKPNPISPDGPFIGYPLLSVGGRTDLWGLCSNTTAGGRLDIVYSPVANHAHYNKAACQDIYIQVTPY